MRFGLVIAMVAALGLGACKTAKKADDDMTDITAADENTMGESDSGSAMGLKTVQFPYDSFTLDAGAKSTLKNNAQILKENPSIRVQIEGHCDTRGGIQYNIALGEKRAGAVKKYLVDLGIASDRISTISYGKERLIDTGHSDEAHAKNRRANFAITSR